MGEASLGDEGGENAIKNRIGNFTGNKAGNIAKTKFWFMMGFQLNTLN